MSQAVDLNRAARGTPGFSGADLANLINEAALLAAREGKSEIDMADLEESRDKVRFGKERRSATQFQPGTSGKRLVESNNFFKAAN